MQKGRRRRPQCGLNQAPLGKGADIRACHHQVIEHPHVDQRQRRLQRLRQELVGSARIDRTRGVVVRQDDSRSIDRQSFLDHLARVDRGLRHRAAEHLLQRNDPVLRIQEQHTEHLVLQRPDLQAQTVLHRLRRRHRGAAPNAMRQGAPRLRQHLLGTRRTVLTMDIGNSGLCRAGLPETEAPRRSAAVRVRRRPQAASVRPASAQTLTARTAWWRGSTRKAHPPHANANLMVTMSTPFKVRHTSTAVAVHSGRSCSDWKPRCKAVRSRNASLVAGSALSWPGAGLWACWKSWRWW